MQGAFSEAQQAAMATRLLLTNGPQTVEQVAAQLRIGSDAAHRLLEQLAPREVLGLVQRSGWWYVDGDDLGALRRAHQALCASLGDGGGTLYCRPLKRKESEAAAVALGRMLGRGSSAGRQQGI